MRPHEITNDFSGEASVRSMKQHHIISSWKLIMANIRHHIQSKILRIPDRFGFFTSGPPPSQIWDLERALVSSALLCLFGVLGVVLFGLSLLQGCVRWNAVAAFAAAECVFIGLIWALACFEHNFLPRDSWGAWEMEIIESDSSAHEDRHMDCWE